MYIPTDPADGVVEISVAILGGKALRDAGSLGHATFKVLDGFSGETRVELIYVRYNDELKVGSGGAVVVVGGEEPLPTGPTPDFDEDGTVGFTDFIQFAQVFGAAQGDGRYNAKFDLDEDGIIGFTDFIYFAQAYGKSASEWQPPLGRTAGM